MSYHLNLDEMNNIEINKIDGVFNINKKEILVRENILLYESSLKCLKDMLISGSSQDEQRGIFISFVINSNYTLEIDNIKISSNSKNQTIIASISHFKRSIAHLQSMHHKSIAIFVGFDFIKKHFPLFYEKYYDRGYQILKNSPTSPKTHICINQIINNSYTGKLKDFFIESKVLEILSFEFDELFKKQNKSLDFRLDDYEKNAIIKAQKILLDEYDNPPSIIDLSKRIKLNEFKFKKGFKIYFKQTPYEMVREKRLFEAKRLLESSEYSIKEVAQIIGIKNQSYLSKIFYEKFKILPKSLMQTRKYYV